VKLAWKFDPKLRFDKRIRNNEEVAKLIEEFIGDGSSIHRARTVGSFLVVEDSLG
jgi:hypothetical protein